MKNIHETNEDRLATTSAKTLSAVEKVNEKIVEATKAIKELHLSSKDKTTEIEVGAGVAKTLKQITATLEGVQADIKKSSKVVDKLDEVKSASLVTNRHLKDIKDKNPQEVQKVELVDTGIFSAIKWVKGNTGEKGKDGKDGAKGEKGDTGKTGQDGKNGRDGKDGKNGKDGVGIDGKDGRDGENGKDGSPDTPDEVVEKINEATKKIDPKQVRGLKEAIAIVDTFGSNPVGIGSGANQIKYRNSSGVIISDHVTDLEFGTGITPSYSSGKITLTASGGHTIEDEGVAVTQRDTMNFVGPGVEVTDVGGKTIVTISTSAGAGFQAPTGGSVDGANKDFTFATEPNALSVDGLILRKTASDSTTNWTGTTAVSLTVAPNFDIFGVA